MQWMRALAAEAAAGGAHSGDTRQQLLLRQVGSQLDAVLEIAGDLFKEESLEATTGARAASNPRPALCSAHSSQCRWNHEPLSLF